MKVIVWSFKAADSTYVSMDPLVQPIEQISLEHLVLLIVTLHGCNDITLWIGKSVFKHLILKSVIKWLEVKSTANVQRLLTMHNTIILHLACCLPLVQPLAKGHERQCITTQCQPVELLLSRRL